MSKGDKVPQDSCTAEIHLNDEGARLQPRRRLGFLSLSLLTALMLVLSACDTNQIASLSAASAQPVSRPVPAYYVFEGKGYGHGVGMSQYGARNRAEAGQGYQAILSAYYPGMNIAPAPDVGGLRVLIRDTATETIAVQGQATILIGDQAPVAIADAPVVVGRAGPLVTAQLAGVDLCAGIDCTTGISIVPQPGSGFTVAGLPYRHGHLEVRPSVTDATKLAVIVANVAMENYLLGIAEVPLSWPTAALQTQVVAARTFALKKVLERRSPTSTWGQPYDLRSTTLDQVYVGSRDLSSPNGARWIEAVSSTNGQVMFHNGQLVLAVYSSSNGGHSENSEYVWGSNIPYLRGVPDQFDAAGNPKSTWTRVLDAATMTRYLDREADTSVGAVTMITISDPFGISGRIDKATVTIAGEKGTKTVTGTRFRAVLNDGIRAAGGSTDQLLLSTNVVMTPR